MFTVGQRVGVHPFVNYGAYTPLNRCDPPELWEDEIFAGEIVAIDTEKFAVPCYLVNHGRAAQWVFEPFLKPFP